MSTIKIQNDLTILTQNIDGLNKKFNIKEFDRIIINQQTIPDVISLTEVHIKDLRKLASLGNLNIADNNYIVFVPKCTLLEKCSPKSAVGTCLLVREDIQKKLKLEKQDAQVFPHYMKHSCDIRECRVKSKKQNIEIVSVYVPVSFKDPSELWKKERNVSRKNILLELFNKIVESKEKQKKIIYLGDFNYFKAGKPGYKEIDELFDLIPSELNFWSFVDSNKSPHSTWNNNVLDYIFTNCAIIKASNTKTPESFSDHSTLLATIAF
ncbi:endonuclease/exonuclease/phosphatase family protein [Streptococcus caprae]|uniref:Endonuclease/exonuclease/phosphatase family protein n=1 Tax=Streptococcus caprae TaxID=1640501 RepID=A0ABV8CTW9_9STRE